MPELPKRNFTGGELAPALHARADLTKYQNGVATLRNFYIHPQGGVSNRTGLKFIGETKDSSKTSRLIPFEFNKEQAYVLEFGDLYMRVIKDDGHVLESALAITGATQAFPVVVSVLNSLSNGDEVYITNVQGMIELNNKRYIVSGATSSTIELSGVDGTGYTAYTAFGQMGRIFTLTTPYLEADIPLLKFTQSADIMTICHPSYSERDLSRTNHDVWSLDEISYSPTVPAPTGLGLAGGGAGGGENTKDYEYVVTAVDASGEESLQSSAVSINTLSLDGTHYVEVDWGAVTGADYYNIYKAESSVSDIYGWIGESKTLLFRDYNLLPDISDTPAVDRDPFSAVDDYPGVVGYYQQRQVFARTNNNIQTLFTTQSGNFKSMRISRPIKADDAIERTIASRKVNEIRHFVELDHLLVLTSGGEWKVTEGQDNVMTPASIGFRRQTEYGASHVPPVIIGNSALFVQLGGKTIRDLAYSFQSDGYSGNDVSILSKHLFKNRQVKEWAYAQEPDGIVWTVMDDGAMIGLTFQKEHQIWGWHRHDTNGDFESIATIPDADLDGVYVIVKRTINGATKRYVEKLVHRTWTTAADAFIVDSGLTYEDDPDDPVGPVTTITGLHHLEGETVVVLGDGNVILKDDVGSDIVVSNGAITLPIGVEKAHIGLSYTSDIKTLDIDTEDPVRGKPMNIGECIVKVEESRGGYVGPNEGQLRELPSRTVPDSYDSLALKTTDYRVSVSAQWSTNGQLFIRQTDPLPMTILAVVPDVDIG